MLAKRFLIKDGIRKTLNYSKDTNIEFLLKSYKTLFEVQYKISSYDYEFTSNLVLYGTTYKIGFYLNAIDTNDLFIIKDLIITQSKDVYVVCKKYNVLEYNKHLMSYLIGSCTDNYVIKDIDSFTCPINVHTLPCCNKAFRLQSF